MANKWIQYDPGPRENYIPMAKWGKDHFSTLAYVETCAVDNGGILDNRKMRTNPRLHRELVGLTLGQMSDSKQYPTRLKGKEKQEKHDDWSCLEDMAAFGLLFLEYRVVDHSRMFGNSEAKVTFTPLGKRISSDLRLHKINGGVWADFVPRL